MRIGIDVDGVLADFVKRCGEVCLEILGQPVDNSGWGLGLTPEQEDQFWRYVDKAVDFWESLEVLPNVPVPLQFHKNDTVFFITKRADSAGKPVELQTATWVGTKLQVPYPTVLALKNKGEVCKALRVDVFIDDKPENCYDVQENSPDTRVYLLNQPWNQWDEKLPRIAHMEEFVERRQHGKL